MKRWAAFILAFGILFLMLPAPDASAAPGDLYVLGGGGGGGGAAGDGSSLYSGGGGGGAAGYIGADDPGGSAGRGGGAGGGNGGSGGVSGEDGAIPQGGACGTTTIPGTTNGTNGGNGGAYTGGSGGHGGRASHNIVNGVYNKIAVRTGQNGARGNGQSPASNGEGGAASLTCTGTLTASIIEIQDLGTQQVDVDVHTLNVLNDTTITLDGNTFWEDVIFTNVTVADGATLAIDNRYGWMKIDTLIINGTSTVSYRTTNLIVTNKHVMTTPGGLGIDYVNEKITGLTASAGYLIGGSDVNADVSGKVDIDAAWLGNSALQVIRKGDGVITSDSDAATLNVPTRPAAPDVTGVSETQRGRRDGKITGVSTAMEYKLSTALGWTACAGTEVSGLAPGTYQVRMKQAGSAFAGTPAAVTIAQGPNPIPTTWTLPKTFLATKGFGYLPVEITSGSPSLTYKLSNKRADIDKDGVLTAKTTGKVTLTVKDSAGASMTCKVTVMGNSFKRTKPLMIKGQTKLFSSTKRLYYKNKKLYAEVFLYNRTGKTARGAGAASFELRDGDGVLFKKEIPEWNFKTALKNKRYKVYKITITEAMLSGVAEKAYDLGHSELHALLLGPGVEPLNASMPGVTKPKGAAAILSSEPDPLEPAM